MNRRTLLLGAFPILLTLQGPVDAHTLLASASPPSGSVLEKVPDTLTLTFAEPTRLVALTLTTLSEERKIGFQPAATALEFVASQPELGAGRNEITWRALSRDGHVVEGKVIIIVRPTP